MYKTLKITTSILLAISLSGCLTKKDNIETPKENKRLSDKNIKRITMPFAVQQDMQEISLDDRGMKRKFTIEHFYHRDKRDVVDVIYTSQDLTKKDSKEQDEFFVMELNSCSGNEIKEYATVKTKELIRICKNEFIEGKGILILEEID